MLLIVNNTNFTTESIQYLKHQTLGNNSLLARGNWRILIYKIITKYLDLHEEWTIVIHTKYWTYITYTSKVEIK
jgi:hypothetical protein